MLSELETRKYDRNWQKIKGWNNPKTFTAIGISEYKIVRRVYNFHKNAITFILAHIYPVLTILQDVYIFDV